MDRKKRRRAAFFSVCCCSSIFLLALAGGLTGLFVGLKHQEVSCDQTYSLITSPASTPSLFAWSNYMYDVQNSMHVYTVMDTTTLKFKGNVLCDDVTSVADSVLTIDNGDTYILYVCQSVSNTTIVKYNFAGVLQWRVPINYTMYSNSKILHDGNNSLYTYMEGNLTKRNSLTGDFIWTKSFTSTQIITLDVTYNYAISRLSAIGVGLNNSALMQMVQFDTDGNVVRSRILGDFFYLYASTFDSNGNTFVASYVDSVSRITAYDTELNTLWTSEISSSEGAVQLGEYSVTYDNSTSTVYVGSNIYTFSPTTSVIRLTGYVASDGSLTYDDRLTAFNFTQYITSISPNFQSREVYVYAYYYVDNNNAYVQLNKFCLGALTTFPVTTTTAPPATIAPCDSNFSFQVSPVAPGTTYDSQNDGGVTFGIAYGQNVVGGIYDNRQVYLSAYEIWNVTLCNLTSVPGYVYPIVHVAIDNVTGDIYAEYICNLYAGYSNPFTHFVSKYNTNGVLQWSTFETFSPSSGFTDQSKFEFIYTENLVYYSNETHIISRNCTNGDLVKSLQLATGNVTLLVKVTYDYVSSIFHAFFYYTNATDAYLLARFDSNGNQMAGAISNDLFLSNMLLDYAGNLYTTGYRIDDNDYKLRISKYDSTYALQWRNNYSYYDESEYMLDSLMLNNGTLYAGNVDFEYNAILLVMQSVNGNSLYNMTAVTQRTGIWARAFAPNFANRIIYFMTDDSEFFLDSSLTFGFGTHTRNGLQNFCLP